MDNEVWVDIPSYENEYQLSSCGRLKSKERIVIYKNQYGAEYPVLIKEKILAIRINKKGYVHYALNKNGKTKEFKAHRLVADIFLPDKDDFKSMPYEDRTKINREQLQVNHKDENKLNNNVDNLEWCTNLYNQLYSNHTKVNQYDVKGNFIKQWDSIKEASIMLGVTHSAIIACCKRKTKSCKGYVWRYADKLS